MDPTALFEALSTARADRDRVITQLQEVTAMAKQLRLAQDIVVAAMQQAMVDQERLGEARQLLQEILTVEESPKGTFTHAHIDRCVHHIKAFLKGNDHAQ